MSEQTAKMYRKPSRRDFLRLVPGAGLAAAAAPRVLGQTAAPSPQAAPVPVAPANGAGAVAPAAPSILRISRQPVIAPDFRQPDEGALGEWYRRMLDQIPNQELTERAMSGGAFNYGRVMAGGCTGLLLAFRVVGDPRLLGEVDRVAQICRDQLREHGGYLSWEARRGDGLWFHAMNHALAHGFFAQYVHALKGNADQPLLHPSHGERTYGDRFNWWLRYLREHHEARWRGHTGRKEGYPIFEPPLSHPWALNILYHHYMEKNVSGTEYGADAPAYADGKRRLMEQFRGTRLFNGQEQSVTIRTAVDIGERGQRYGWVWSHWTGDYSGPLPYGAEAQLFRYGGQTAQMMGLIAADGEEVLGPGSTEEVARTLARIIMYRPTKELDRQPEGAEWHEAWANDINGHDERLLKVPRFGTRVDGTPGIIPLNRGFSWDNRPPGREPLWRLTQNTFAPLAAFADDRVVVDGESDFQRILAQCEVAYQARQRMLNIPASMVWALAFKKGIA